LLRVRLPRKKATKKGLHPSKKKTISLDKTHGQKKQSYFGKNGGAAVPAVPWQGGERKNRGAEVVRPTALRSSIGKTGQKKGEGGGGATRKTTGSQSCVGERKKGEKKELRGPVSLSKKDTSNAQEMEWGNSNELAHGAATRKQSPEEGRC